MITNLFNTAVRMGTLRNQALALALVLVGMLPNVAKADNLQGQPIYAQNNTNRTIWVAARYMPPGSTSFVADGFWKVNPNERVLILYNNGVNIYWAPYDDRTGTTPTMALPDYTGDKVQGLIFPFVENNRNVFNCPKGIDPTSANAQDPLQISYAINPDVGGKRLNEVGGYILVIEHDDLPSCRGVSDHFTTWPADDATRADRHGPSRHLGRANSLLYDGSIPSGF